MTRWSRFRRSPDEEYFFAEGCFILEYLNDPADPEASIARARVPQSGATRRHRLLATTERYLIISGVGEVTIADDPPVSVGPGDAILIPPGTTQSITNTGPEDLVFLAICTPRFVAANYRDAPL